MCLTEKRTFTFSTYEAFLRMYAELYLFYGDKKIEVGYYDFTNERTPFYYIGNWRNLKIAADFIASKKLPLKEEGKLYGEIELYVR